MIKKNLVIIGGGPAGLAAAVSAYDAGERDILIVEREKELGGILNQCIHNGFGLHTFKEELTGPEYADRYIQMVKTRGIEYVTKSTVVDLTEDKKITFVSEKQGLVEVEAKAIILACGCRERPRGAINIAGMRGAGVYSAGTAQKLVNIDGYMPGKEVVILGSGDIGLIMARRMTFEGAKVKCVVELMPYSGGLNRNIVQCLDDFNIPLKFSHSVIEIKGKKRVEGVVIAKVDERLQPIEGTEEYIPCDTLLLSVGLLPENELASNAKISLSNITNGAIVDDSMMTNVEGVFQCGNVLHVHDLVDFVSVESAIAGNCAVDYLNGKKAEKDFVDLKTVSGIRYSVPSKISRHTTSDKISLKMRVDNVYKNVIIKVTADGAEVFSKKRNIVAPGEMENIDLKSDVIEKIKQAHDVKIYLEKGE